MSLVISSLSLYLSLSLSLFTPSVELEGRKWGFGRYELGGSVVAGAVPFPSPSFPLSPFSRGGRREWSDFGIKIHPLL
ncbi:hypothetical protein IE53DRAFT_389552 [Violaceomyces palustris]|uniref:Uncharacterized protein n=1 Tax=Violaceomyces palustris TaxID=1673888 RepID=A0ACD0NR35_9BASI|nr:hypothetical protein IE53DRAFT_389552 [Violaceomyces palustris]